MPIKFPETAKEDLKILELAIKDNKEYALFIEEKPDFWYSIQMNRERFSTIFAKFILGLLHGDLEEIEEPTKEELRKEMAVLVTEQTEEEFQKEMEERVKVLEESGYFD